MTYLRDGQGRFRASKFWAWGIVSVMIIGLGLGLLNEWAQGQTIIYKNVEVVVPATTTPPVLERIAKCESGNKQTGKSGQVLAMANKNGTVDIGKYQINISVWGATATKLGFDLSNEKDNEAFAKYLYENFGTEPWGSSSDCWK